MSKQGTFAGGGFEKYGRKTRRELFLDEMEVVMPWRALVAVIEPYYPRDPGPQGGRKRPNDAVLLLTSSTRDAAGYREQ
jgi:IS5 family transposase